MAAKKGKSTKPEQRPLTLKQMAFCTWYVSAEVNGNGVEAARRAGYRGTDATLAVVANENIRKPNLKNEIDRRMEKALSGAHVTVENTLRKLDVVYAKALEHGKYGPAVRAAELQGKYLKMFTDRIEHLQDVEDMSLDQLIALYKELEEDGGVNISELVAGNGSGDSASPNPPADKTTH